MQLKGVSKHYADQPVVDGVSFTLTRASRITLIGPNGAGKTTILRLLLGLEQPDTGSVELKPGLRIGYVPQHFSLPATLPLTVRWWLESVPQVTPLLVEEMAGELNIGSLLPRKLHRLSGGELQRVMLARALLHKPDLLVLDEPAQGIDINGQAELFRLIERASKERGTAVLMVSHDLHLVMSSTTEVLCLNHHVCCHGTPQQINDDPAFIALFGDEVSKRLAWYRHEHDHTHDMAGHVVEDGHHHG